MNAAIREGVRAALPEIERVGALERAAYQRGHAAGTRETAAMADAEVAAIWREHRSRLSVVALNAVCIGAGIGAAAAWLLF